MKDRIDVSTWIPEMVVDYFTEVVIEDYWGTDGVTTEKDVEQLVQANIDAFCQLGDEQKLEIYQDAAEYLGDAQAIALATELQTHLESDALESAFEKASESQALAQFSLDNQKANLAEHQERVIAYYLAAVLNDANQKGTVSNENILETAELMAARVVAIEPQPATIIEKAVLHALDLKELGQNPEQHFAGLLREAHRYAENSFDKLMPFVHNQILEMRMIEEKGLAQLEQLSDKEMRDALDHELHQIDVAAAKLSQHVLGLEHPKFTHDEIKSYIEPLGIEQDHPWSLSEMIEVVNNGERFAEIDFDFWAKANEAVPEVIAEIEESVLASLVEDGYEIDWD